MNDTLQQATTNPALGVAIFALGGLAGAVFYMPFKKVTRWAWESYWLVYAVVGLIVVPWVLALSTSPNVFSVIRQTPAKEIGYCFLCGAMWGVGGLTWGLMIRYLGVGLGLAIGCGLCSAAGTLIPPILAGHPEKLFGDLPAQISLAAVIVSVAGIVLIGMAGISKEKELSEEEKKKAVAEYNFGLGLTVAIFSGLMSAGMNFGLQGGIEMSKLAATVAPITSPTWTGMPVLVVVLAGGFVVNCMWCLMLNAKNKTFADYTRGDAPLLANLFFAALAGAIWCSQFICLKTGEPAMGQMAYIGFSVLFAAAILFSTILGIMLGEWKGTSGRTRGLLAVGLLVLLSSTCIAAYSGYAAEKAKAAKAAAGAQAVVAEQTKVAA